MDALKPGHYWKTPFIWEPGCPEPPGTGSLRYEPAERAWLEEAITATMGQSLDESDRFTVAKIGLNEAMREVFEVSSRYFEEKVGWLRVAVDKNGQRVGFVMTTVFAEPSRWKNDRPQGTILYMGVLPIFRGHGFALDLVLEATRQCIGANCWRIFCDTGSSNHPMIGAFRKAGYQERTPWQRPLA